MDAILNHARRVAEEASSSRAVTRHGIVDGYDPANHAVRARLQPDDTLTDWMPLKSTWIGNGWGMILAPSVGDAVEIDFQEADGGVGSVGWRFYNDSDRPLNVPSGEAWLVHKQGQSIKLTTDGKLTLDDGHGAVITLNGDGTIASSGTWAHTGTFSANGIGLTTHHHIGVQPGSGNSGAPAA